MSRTSIVQYFLIAGVAFFLFVTPDGRAFADCSFEALPSSGFSIVCTNTITEGITGTDQADIIRFLPQASLIYHVTNAGNSSSLATVIGIEGLQGNDEVINAGDIEDLLAQAETTAESVSLTIDDSFIGDVTGSVVSDTNATADATAIGIDGGPGNDRIDNQATISADVAAIVKATDVAVNINVTADGTVTGASASNASVVANAKAIGIDGDDNNDSILNSGDMELHADAEAEAVSVSLVVSGSIEGNVDGEALSDASVAANAFAIGIDGGPGMDTMINDGAIVADVDSSATAVGVSVDVAITAEGTAEGASVSDASVTASATATGMDGGEDDDVIDNRGDVDLKANADAVGVAVSLTVAGTAKGDARGESVSDASVTSAATVTGISGGGGDDSIVSDGTQILADVNSTATAVSVGLTVSGSMDGNVEGEALTDGSATANATATGISGGLGIDTITNWAGIFENVDAGATTVAVGADVAISIEEGGNATGAALSDASVLANAAATGIDGGDGGDAINNRGDIGLLSSADGTGVAVSLNLAGSMKGDALGKAVSDASVTAHATASGIDGGDGGDAIVNEGTITLMNGVGDDTIDAKAIAVGVSLDISGSMEGNVEGEALSDSSAAANAEAIGIYGGQGIDAITNYGAILAAVDTSATAVGVSVDVGLTGEGTAEGAALSNASVLAQAGATGIDGGDNGDDIDNRGAVALLSSAEATGVAVSLDIAGSMKGDALGKAVSDAGVTADATATGIAGGNGSDTIVSDGLEISADVAASATAVSVGLTVSGSMEGNVAGEVLTDGSAMANATAAGIDGGLGIDTISNRANIFENVDAGATTVAVGVDVAIAIEEGGNVTGAALSDASVTASAAASGIAGGGDADAIGNRGDIALLSNSDATGVAVSLTVAGTVKGDAEGSSVSDASVTATSTATGIDGGEGDDRIDNEGMITLMNGVGDDETDAGATAVSVALTVSGSMEGNVAGEALSDSSATADAMAIGIDGGSGIDEITNRGAIVGNVDSSATAVGVGLDVNLIIAKEGDVEGNVSGAALSDASVTATSLAAGIDAGAGTDNIDNRGDLSLSASTDATGVAVSLAVAGSVACKGGVEGEIAGKALSNASTAAYAETTGIDGGEDSDQIINTGNFSLLQAESSSTGVSAAVEISAGVAADGDAKVNVEGTAVSDARVTAEAKTSAIRGGGGEDEIINTGDFVNLKSASDAISVAASLNVTGALAFKGDADASTSGSAVSAASANALATTVAIDGGAGNDIIRNTGNIINLESDSTATSVSAGVNVSAVVAIKGNAEADVTGEAVGDSRVISRALTLGLAGGLGNDEIDNEGDISLLSTADATGVAAELNVSASLNFKGFSMSDVSGAAASNSAVSAKAEAIGIDGGWGRDTIRNS
ncbi:MAG: hypothetical protein GQ578_08995, partial [Desulfuromonadaceae bacterium]|nr:hypothetical protein [Desulfuromonadaceae bacterium]